MLKNYQVTARKWRPQDFSQVVGQEHVTTALTNAINSGKVPHAYLFSGPRGVGKTSTARILSKLLNCVNSPNICGVCASCKEISIGQSLDVREIDGASNRGIEQIREIRDNAVYAPLSSKYKIFIIDEVHMLTKEASNALLKILEEPPAHVIFMLATTEANKVLPTIRSRCQHYLLKNIPLNILIDRLSFILEQEGIDYEKEAIEEIAQAGDGSMRDSQTILDQVILYSQGMLTLQATRNILGIPDTVYFENILKGIFAQDTVSVLEQCNTYLTEIGDGVSFAENLTKFLRNALLVKKLPSTHELLDMSQEKYQELQNLLSQYEDKEIVTLLNLSLDLCDILRKEVSERFWIESSLFKMLDYKNRFPISELRTEILKILGRNTQNTNNLEKNIQSHIPAKTPKDLDNSSANSTFGSLLDNHNKNQQQTNIKEKSLKQESYIENHTFENTTISTQSNLSEDIQEKKIVQNQQEIQQTDIETDSIENTIKNLFEI